MKRIAVLRWNTLPSFVTWDIPNTDELLAEDNLVLEGFKAHGFEAVSIVWNKPDMDWHDFDAALIRSTWDYIDETPRFLDALSRIEASSCRLFNPLDAVRWNIDKNYLFDLENSGVPIIPTFLFDLEHRPNGRAGHVRHKEVADCDPETNTWSRRDQFLSHTFS